MKKFYLITLLSFLSLGLFASHLMGGELVVKHDSAFNHNVILRLYRDAQGIPLAQNQTVHVYDTTAGVTYDILLTIDSSGFLPTSAYSVEWMVYSAQVSLQNGFYYFGWDQCCRNNAIVNATNPGGASMQLHAGLLVDGNGNSTPDFMIQPALVVPEDTVWTHNSLPFDPNGDSIAWVLSAPLDLDTSSNGSGQVFVDGYYLPPSDSAGPFTINPATGTISWDPAYVGNFIASVLVEEFRNGQRIGTIRRDYQFIVVSDSSNLRIANLNQIPVNLDGNYEVEVEENVNTSFDLVAANSAGTVKVNVVSEILEFASNPANLSFIPGTNTMTARIDWTPNASQKRERPYPVVFQLSDDFFIFDFTVLFAHNKASVGIEETAENIASVYPVPSSGPLHISAKGNIDLIQVYNLQGALISQYTPNANSFRFDNQLAPGNYIVKVKSAERIQSFQFVIQ